MSRHYPLVAARAGHRCEYCHAPEAVFNFPFEVEHIIPSSLGGGDEDANLALACRSCNVLKSASVTGIDPESQEEVRLYHPRNDSWEVHFHVEIETAEVRGHTAIGRATVLTMQINREAQRTARQQWMRLDLFP